MKAPAAELKAQTRMLPRCATLARLTALLEKSSLARGGLSDVV
jgi:hypothetical protein